MGKPSKPSMQAAWKANACSTQRHIEFCSAGLPPVARDKYCAHDAAINPRIPPILRQRSGEISLMQRFCPHFQSA